MAGSSEESTSSSSSHRVPRPTSYTQRAPLPGQGLPGAAASTDPSSPPISPTYPEGAPLLTPSTHARSSSYLPANRSPLNPSSLVQDTGASSSSASSTKASNEDTDYYNPPPATAGISRYSAASNRLSGVDGALLADLSYHDPAMSTPSLFNGSFARPYAEKGRASSASLYTMGTGDDPKQAVVKTATTEALLWDEKNLEADDYLHNPIAGEPEYPKRRWWSQRGVWNIIAISVVLGGLIGLFMMWPIVTYVINVPPSRLDAWNIGGVNATGQVPFMTRGMIDSDTPSSAFTKTSTTGETLNLVFSDEFNTDGRTFWPGDDPYWEAVDLWYWATHNMEWYDPDAVTTKDGNLEITFSQQPTHGLNFRGGMIQSWNKMCYNDNAHVEVSVSLPGRGDIQGLWPAAWSMGNLARAGYGATNDGTWPYSYDSCDVGTQANQTNTDRRTPADARSSGSTDYGGELSWLPGQRLSACTCSGDDHPGPRNDVGRSGPEIDILEAQVDYHGYGTVSQSVQIAPFDPGYLWANDTAGHTVYDAARTDLNDWKGSITQEAASAVTILDNTSYNGVAYQSFAYEYETGDDGFITWLVGGQPTWTLRAAAFRPNAGTEIGQRLIPVEPMYLLLNLGMSDKFQTIEFQKLLENNIFPAVMRVDYVRVYQKGRGNTGCDPKDYPTADYIDSHLEAYNNPNATSWLHLAKKFEKRSLLVSLSPLSVCTTLLTCGLSSSCIGIIGFPALSIGHSSSSPNPLNPIL